MTAQTPRWGERKDGEKEKNITFSKPSLIDEYEPSKWIALW